jgi:hypothetical protein
MSRIIVRDSDLHSHLMARMKQRGITRQEIEDTINSGRVAEDAKEGSLGKTLAFPYNDYWEGKWFEEKEVTVYYLLREEGTVLFTAIARYGKGFAK